MLLVEVVRRKKFSVFGTIEFWFTMITLVVLVVVLLHFLTKETLPIGSHRSY